MKIQASLGPPTFRPPVASAAPAKAASAAPAKVKDADGDYDGDKAVVGPGGATTVKLSSAATQALAHAASKDHDGDAA